MNKKLKFKKQTENSLEEQLASMEKQKLLELFTSLMKQNAEMANQLGYADSQGSSSR
ncbi:MAG: hypothetical protein WCL37_01935 [Chrysiogenales bacterium]